ncbi:uncharacterized protein TNIN_3551 [Trichonephila inaurata madagascariensis]|uniref:Uncharacterized protein n=1 Tax=Trichonephila inaurata madagascariensis TaxID=2747483 RepID=A0A8X6WQB5_9ARAC|nr:uncharacterized protein TNIN_3551 [Trichonephila inaurata madagascariensis]
MSWWICVLILTFYYLFFCFHFNPVITKPPGPEPIANNFEYKVKFDNGYIEFKTSNNGFWEFPLEEDFYFDNGKIQLKDDCFYKLPGSKIEAKGKTLYDYVQNDKLVPGQGGSFNIFVNSIIQNGYVFYFKCGKNKIESLHACPPGQIFQDSECVPVHPCTNKKDGENYEDPFNRQFYFKCPEGIRVECPPNTYFIHDSCRTESIFYDRCRLDSKFRFNINSTLFIACVNGEPVLHQCPPDTILVGDECKSIQCLNKPNGTKVPFPKETLGLFSFSTGYFICEKGNIRERVQCPNEWDWYESKGDNLTFLPQVFGNDKCDIPEICENVLMNDTDAIVPVHEFTKHVRNWKNSLLFDSSLGYRCLGNKKQKVQVPDGYHISDYKIKPACNQPGQRVVLSSNIDKYYDYDQQTVLNCPKDTFFDGTECINRIPGAHRFKNVDIFKFNNLEFNWMIPWNYSKVQSIESTCTSPESFYINGYNICSHPECKMFPFLKQLKASIRLSDTDKCEFNDGKIKKLKTLPKGHLNFWSQRYKPYPSTHCTPKSRVQSGHFVLDSVLYATCDHKQPFVFCPSALTDKIEKFSNVYACVPKDEVFESVLEANTTKLFLENHLERVIPITPGTLIKINGKLQNYDPNGIKIDNNPVEIWSNKNIRLIFKTLVNHPPNTYFSNKTLKTFKPNRYFVMRYAGGSTVNPLEFKSYDVESSVKEFISDAY